MSGGRLKLAVRRDGGQVIVVCEPDGPLVQGMPEGWQESGGPVEVMIATELLARIEESAPDPLAVVAGGCIEVLIEAVAATARAWPGGNGAEA